MKPVLDLAFNSSISLSWYQQKENLHSHHLSICKIFFNSFDTLYILSLDIEPRFINSLNSTPLSLLITSLNFLAFFITFSILIIHSFAYILVIAPEILIYTLRYNNISISDPRSGSHYIRTLIPLSSSLNVCSRYTTVYVNSHQKCSCVMRIVSTRFCPASLYV